MQKSSENYKKYIDENLSLSPKSKIVVDGKEYLGNTIKTAPKFSHSNTSFIGGFPTKTVEFEILNLDDDIDFEGKELHIYKGLFIDGIIEYIKQGVFIPQVENIETNVNTKTISFKGVADRTQFLNDSYESSLDWSIKHSGLEIIEEICNKKHLVLKNKDFHFANYMFEQPNFPSNITNREVISRMGEIGGEIAIFDNNGYLEIKSQTITDDTITRRRYTKLTREKEFSPNVLVIGNKGYDNDIMYPNPEPSNPIEYKIEDNPYIDLNREEMIELVANYVLNTSYTPFKIENFVDNFIYELNDVIDVVDKDGTTFKAVLLNISTSSRIKSKLEAPFKNKTTSKYELAGSNKQSLNEVKFQVNHIEKKVEATVQLVDEHSNQMAQQQITIDTIQQQISGEYGMDREVFGTNQVFIEDAMNYYPLEIKIDGYSDLSNLIYPSENLYPSEDLYPLSYIEQPLNLITLCIDSQDREHPTEDLKEFPITITNPLRSLRNVKDELLIETTISGELKAQITRYLDYKDGQIVLLDKPTVETITSPEIELLEHCNYVYIKEKPNYQIGVRYLIYSTTNRFYATRIELATSRKQTEESIIDTVSKTYSTKEELAEEKSERIQTIAGITEEVSKKANDSEIKTLIETTAGNINIELSRKTNSSDIIATINASPENLQILFNKIGITANDVLNIIAGNEINLSSRNISLNADNCSIDRNGNAKFKNGEFEGKLTSNEGVIGGWNINGNGLTNGTVFLNKDGSSTIYTVADLIIIREYIKGNSSFKLSPAMIRHYDFDGDGQVLAVDYVRLQNLIGISMN